MSKRKERKFIMNQPNDKAGELFDLSLIETLRSTVNKHTDLSAKLRGKKGESAWDAICAIMHRISETAQYLNENHPIPGNGQENHDSFILYNFLNHSASMIGCIDKLADIFGADRKNIDGLSDIFDEPGSDGKGSDKKYFEYLRSLCSVHPVGTDRHQRYQGDNLEWCPYVDRFAGFYILLRGTDGFKDKQDPNFIAKVYTSTDKFGKHLPIYLDQIFQYAQRRYEFINDILPKIDEYYEKKFDEYRRRKIKQPEDFGTYPEYIKNLQKEIEERTGVPEGYPFLNFFSRALEVSFDNPARQEIVAAYQAELKPAVADLHETVQNMSYDEEGNLDVPDSFYRIMNPGPEGGLGGWGAYDYEEEKITDYLLTPVDRDEISSMPTINPERMQGMLDAYDQCVEHEKTKTDADRNMVMRALDSHFSPNNSEWARLQMKAMLPELGSYAEHVDLLLPDVELATLWRAILYRMQGAAKVKQP